MRTTATNDDILNVQALEIANPGMEKSDIFREAVKTFIRAQTSELNSTKRSI